MVTMTVLEKGLYRARLATGERDLAALLDLRSRLFRPDGRSDADAFDARFRHLLIETRDQGAVVAGMRFQTYSSWHEAAAGYAAQYYDIRRKSPQRGRLCEVGRLVVAPDGSGPDALRLLFGALTGLATREGVSLLFGCVSLPGAEPARHAAVLRHLAGSHLLGGDWAIETIAPESVTLGPPEAGRGDPVPQGLPPLLRTYLAMGARVGGRAVVDRDLDTLQVLTVLDARDVPRARLAALQGLAG